MMPKRDLLRFLVRGFRGFGLRLVKSIVKLAIGRKPHFYAQDHCCPAIIETDSIG